MRERQKAEYEYDYEYEKERCQESQQVALPSSYS